MSKQGTGPSIFRRLADIAFGRKTAPVQRQVRTVPVAQKLERPEGVVIWVHGDDLAHIGPGPVIAQELSTLIETDVHTLLTANADIAVTRENGTYQQPAPRDSADSIERFLNHWQPAFGLVIGTPDNAHLLNEAARRMPMFQAVPARNDRGAPLRYPAYMKGFHTCLASSAAEASAARQQLRGAKVNVEIVGPLSDTVHALPCNQAECDALAKLLGGRPVWLAANITNDEVAMINSAHRKAFRTAHRLLLIVVPADPGDGPALARTMEDANWQTGLRSIGDEPDPDIQVYVADTTEELGLWYRLAPSTFIGGTMSRGSAPPDPFHPAALGSAVLHGPHTGDRPARFHRLASQGASVQIADADELGSAIITLLSPDKAASLAQAGWATTTESAHVVERLAELMQIELERSGASV